MKSIFKKIQKQKKKLFIILGFLLIILIYFIFRPSTSETSSSQFAVIETVERGVVSSGIETTGTIVAANKLSLDVYKQSKRIEVVNAVNGGHVEEGDVLFSFDKSSANVAAQSAQTKVTEAKLALQQEQENYFDDNTEIKTLDQQIEDLYVSLEQTEDDKIDAYKDYLNANLEAIPEDNDLLSRNAPVISGYYNDTEPGEYHIEVYQSAADSGYSISINGLYSGKETVYINKSIDLGDSGLEISFSDDIKNGDEWVVTLPNTFSSQHQKAQEVYEQEIIDIDNSIASYKNDIDIKIQNLGDASYTDSSDYRELRLAQAQAELSEAQVQLSENYEVIRDQDIIAPFSGTIDGLENVVVGATPSGGSEDPISFGTLISDEFLVNFSLGVVDVAKIEIGQKVLVTVTSFTNTEPLEAFITEISSLPESDGVAQYQVQALITPSENMSFELREGLLADIEIIEEEVSNVIRIPRSVVSYENREARVEILDNPSDLQQEQIDRLGIIRLDEMELASYFVVVELGLEGAYYVEIISGLEEGQYVISTESSEEETSVISGFGPGSRDGGGPPPGN